MNRDFVLEPLRRHQQDLYALGVLHIALFGSLARGESPANDIDLAVKLSQNFSLGGFDYFGRMEELEQKLGSLLGKKVDVVEEPVRKPRIQEEIDRDRAIAY